MQMRSNFAGVMANSRTDQNILKGKKETSHDFTFANLGLVDCSISFSFRPKLEVNKVASRPLFPFIIFWTDLKREQVVYRLLEREWTKKGQLEKFFNPLVFLHIQWKQHNFTFIMLMQHYLFVLMFEMETLNQAFAGSQSFLWIPRKVFEMILERHFISLMI